MMNRYHRNQEHNSFDTQKSSRKALNESLIHHPIFFILFYSFLLVLFIFRFYYLLFFSVYTVSPTKQAKSQELKASFIKQKISN